MGKELIKFLEELSQHNNKEWMDAHKERYLTIKASFLEHAADILAHLSLQDPRFGALKPKDCVFRQNRDVRFSANKQPYKINFAAYFAAGGKKAEGPGYYLHLQPGESFLGGGIWMPQGETLKKIRQEIDYSGQELENLLTETSFQSYFGEMQGEQLKTAPRDFDKDHPFIHFLRYKSFIVSKPLSDQAVMTDKYISIAKEAFEKMKPFHDFLDKAMDQAEDGSGLI